MAKALLILVYECGDLIINAHIEEQLLLSCHGLKDISELSQEIVKVEFAEISFEVIGLNFRIILKQKHDLLLIAHQYVRNLIIEKLLRFVIIFQDVHRERVLFKDIP